MKTLGTEWDWHIVGLMNNGSRRVLELQVFVYRSHPGPCVSLTCLECHGFI